MEECHEVVFCWLKERMADVAVHNVEVGAVRERVAKAVAVGFECASELATLACVFFVCVGGGGWVGVKCVWGGEKWGGGG